MGTVAALPKTLVHAVRYFAKPENCLSYMVASRWGGTVTRPTCGSDGVYFDKSRMGSICKSKHPKRKFSLKTGTIFEDSPIGLDKWLPAVWMIAGAKNGISSHELGRALGVTQKTAWFMLHRIRLAMQDRSTGGKLGGDVEADETYIGGRARNMHFHKRKEVIRGRGPSKVAVMGLLERSSADRASRVRTHVIQNIRRHFIQGEVRKHVEPGSNLYTDALSSYQGLDMDYVHGVIDHAEAYVKENVHTNGLELWSLLKRGIKGTYVSVEPFHLFRYLDEQAFRFNEREGDDADRFSLAMKGILGRRVMYDELTAHANAERP